MSNVEKREITKELQESYLDYAMSVIVSRALPDVRDGLKPVHRRILWDMWDSGLTHLAKLRKSANTVGQVLGRYHPHSDTAVYDAMVRMAQDWSLRYPLVDGQGNFGSIDGDSAAAMRYTESRLSKIASELLTDIEKETIDWSPNYDATREEPKVLPARLPNLLINGSLGIAVGMTTNIPPHNLSEVADAILHLADNSDATNDDLSNFIKGPDFPTGGLIFDEKAIRLAYVGGRGAILARAKAEIEERKAKAFDIIVTEIPYQVVKSDLIKHIAELAQDKKIEGIKDIRDESDRDGLRIVIELKGDVPPQKILNQLYKHTDLQKDFHLNMIALVDGLQPRLLSLKEVLEHHLDYRKIVIRRRTEFDLRKAKERAHILEGLVKALDSIDKVIATIKKSKDREDARANLMKGFKLTEIQATAILEMRLQTLVALERHKLEAELKEKHALIKELELILKSPAKILKIIKDEVTDLKKTFGDERRTKLISSGITAFKEEDLVPEEEAIITLSGSGYVKRLPPDTFKEQRRGGKGLIGSDVAEEDFLTQFFTANTHDNLLFFTDKGRVFQTKAYEIPPASRTSKGKAIHNFLEIPTDENISAIINYKEERKKGEAENYLTMATRNGLIKKTPLKDFTNIRRTGIIAIALKKGDLLKGVRLSGGKDQIMLATEKGQSIRFKESQIRSMGRTAAGIRAMRLKKDDHIAGFDIITGEAIAHKLEGLRLLIVMSNGFGKQTALKEYKVQNRGGSGIRTANVTPKTGTVIVAQIVSEEKEIFALSAKGQVIRTALSGVRATGRAAQGVRIMNLKSGDRLAGVVVI
jgi:DNA gyrase subunit A